MSGIIDYFVEEMIKEPESNKRNRLYLTQKIKENMRRDHERDERNYRLFVNEYNNEMRRLDYLPDNNGYKQIMTDYYNEIYDIHSNMRNQQNRMYYEMDSELAEYIRKIITNEDEINAIRFAKKTIKKSFLLLLGLFQY